MENFENPKKMYKKYRPRIKANKMHVLFFVLVFIFLTGLLSAQEAQEAVSNQGGSFTETVEPVVHIDEIIDEAQLQIDGVGPVETVPENLALAVVNYERLANEYHEKANAAWNSGNYEAALEYAVRASENAITAREFRGDSQGEVKLSEEENALKIAGEAAASTQSPALNANVLPEFYIVQSWSKERDCFWNIAQRSYVYGNGNLWRLLYDANKSLLPDPNDPNVIEPGTKLRIPARDGETRSGTYEPAAL